MTPLISVPPGSTSDVWSTLPGFLKVCAAAFQSFLLVELAKIFWLLSRRLNIWRFLLASAYAVTLVLDWLHVWAGDWFVWLLYRLQLGELCEPAMPCYPVTAIQPWGSLLFLVVLLIGDAMASRNTAVRSLPQRGP